MLVVTTPHVEGAIINQYLGIVTGDAIMGANIFRDFFAGIRNVVGGRSAAYEKELDRAKQLAFQDMIAKAHSLGATGIVAVDIDYETIGGSMLMVSVSGTAVKFN